MMDALRIARDLGADYAGGIGLEFGTAHPADGLAVDHLDIERAGRRAVVRTGGMPDVDLGALVHAAKDTIKRLMCRAYLSGTRRRKPCINGVSGSETGAAIGVDCNLGAAFVIGHPRLRQIMPDR